MNPTRNDVLFSAPRQKNTDEEEKPTMNMLDESKQPVDNNKLCKFEPNSTVNNTKGKTYCYKYFRLYKYDWRLLLTNEMGNLLSAHAQELESMTRNVSGITPTTSIYQILEMIFLKVNKQHKEKIYDMYQNTQNGQQESCGCGTAAETAYLGHKSTCGEFQWIHERSSYEILLANLQKKEGNSLWRLSATTKQET